jgi:hypothetical protein
MGARRGLVGRVQSKARREGRARGGRSEPEERVAARLVRVAAGSYIFGCRSSIPLFDTQEHVDVELARGDEERTVGGSSSSASASQQARERYVWHFNSR